MTKHQRYIRERGLTLFSTGKFANRKDAEKAAVEEYNRMEERKKELQNEMQAQTQVTQPGDDWQ